MKASVLTLPVFAALMLAGCLDGSRHNVRGSADSPPPPSAKVYAPTPQAAPANRFACKNGLSVFIRNLDADRVELALDDKRAVLTSAVSGSGARYVGTSGLFGRGAEWHVKADEGILNFVDPYGNRVETVCYRATR